MAKSALKVVTKKLSDLIPDPENPRTLSDEARAGLQASLQRFGPVVPIIWNEKTGHVVGGHQRLKVLQDMGAEETDVVVWSGDKDEQRALNVTLNNPAIMGDWDENALAARLVEIRESIGDEDFAALRLEELRQGIIDDSPLEGNTDPDDVPPEPDEPTTERGDVWCLGAHRVMCGDATSVDDVERLMGGRQAFVFTDPPYGIGVVKRDGTIGGDNAVSTQTFNSVEGDDTTDAARDMYTLMGAMDIDGFVIWGGNYFTAFLPPSRCWIVWDKKTGESDFADVEMAWTSLEGSARLYSFLWNGMMREGSVAEELLSRVHPTQKPVGLFRQIMKDIEAKAIYDPFLGSGTTLIAAEQLGRICYGMEIEPRYVDVAVKRWEDFTGKGAHRMGGKG
jgi:hypothetical protein